MSFAVIELLLYPSGNGIGGRLPVSKNDLIHCYVSEHIMKPAPNAHRSND